MKYITYGGGTRQSHNTQRTKPKTINALRPGLVEIILMHKGILRGVFLANHLASTDNLNQQQPRDRTHTNTS